MPQRLKQCLLVFALLALILPTFVFQDVQPAQAAASMSIGGDSDTYVGQDITYTVNINTGGQSANAFDVTFNYPTDLFSGVRGSYAGSICTLPITPATPSGGSAVISCGTPGGFTGSGTVATIVLHSIGQGGGNLTLTSCQVLANDGMGTDITGGCSGKAVNVFPGAPTPTPSATTTPTPTTTARPKPSPTPSKSATPPGRTPTPTPGGTSAPVGSASTPVPTPSITPPNESKLPPSTPTPSVAASVAPQTEKRSIAQAISDVFGSLKDLKSLTGNATAVVALLLTLFPALLIAFAIMFFAYRIYLLERRRRRTLDRLFELELSELASLEGKLDLLAEKGPKGKIQFKEEFQAAKENILRQIKPNYGKPVESAKEDKKAEPPAK